MMKGLRSVKFVRNEPSTSPLVACTTLVFPPAVAHVTRMSEPCDVTAVIWKQEALLVGSVPVRNSQRLSQPSPSGSAFDAAAELVVLPKYWTCQLWKTVRAVT